MHGASTMPIELLHALLHFRAVENDAHSLWLEQRLDTQLEWQGCVTSFAHATSLYHESLDHCSRA